MLTDILPYRGRQILYAILALAGLVLGSIQTAYLTVGNQPTWLTVALTVLSYVATALGAVAGGNLNKTAPAVPTVESTPAATPVDTTSTPTA